MADSANNVFSPGGVSLNMAMRRLWSDHVIWTRDYIIAAVAGAPDAEVAAGRLLRNQDDIGNAVVPLYGEDAGKALTDLLKEHITIAVALIDAAKTGDNAKLDENDRKWTENAEEIAGLLSGANPDNWSKADVTDLLMQHLSLTKAEVAARIDQDWAQDVAAFDDIYTEILTVADVLTAGIVKQFPEMFSNQEEGVSGTA